MTPHFFKVAAYRFLRHKYAEDDQLLKKRFSSSFTDPIRNWLADLFTSEETPTPKIEGEDSPATVSPVPTPESPEPQEPVYRILPVDQPIVLPEEPPKPPKPSKPKLQEQ